MRIINDTSIRLFILEKLADKKKSMLFRKNISKSVCLISIFFQFIISFIYFYHIIEYQLPFNFV
jgi:hypothetical protein